MISEPHSDAAQNHHGPETQENPGDRGCELQASFLAGGVGGAEEMAGGIDGHSGVLLFDSADGLGDARHDEEGEGDAEEGNADEREGPGARELVGDADGEGRHEESLGADEPGDSGSDEHVLEFDLFADEADFVDVVGPDGRRRGLNVGHGRRINHRRLPRYRARRQNGGG